MHEGTGQIKITLTSPEQTRVFGRRIGSLCEADDVICLGGELGAGKTTLAQAIAHGAGVAADEYVTSPTFAVMHEYTGRVPVYHMDFYRLASSEEVIELGLEAYLEAGGISLIEWFERAQEIIPASSLIIHLSFIDESSRLMVLHSGLPRWQRHLSRLEPRLSR
ncbi:MAG: tRNA (adenosine(37)-N6)-threonylcarbamoyltransferase complex ATPase subunit type 1 TsaE [Desulfofustis sp.]|nr:tRNA (adenosine(37)-N6)-threonylcarbamoyltransferase complex ATPase subunit type 1 TsaE [Desulfofustis sp.]